MISRVVPVAIAALLLLAAACDDGGADDAPFVFTPEPYTVVVLTAIPGREFVIADSENGGRYMADEVIVTMDDEDEASFREWATSHGFNDLRRYAMPPGKAGLVVGVPRGSVDAAIAFIKKRQGGVDVERSVLFDLQAAR